MRTQSPLQVQMEVSGCLRSASQPSLGISLCTRPAKPVHEPAPMRPVLDRSLPELTRLVDFGHNDRL